MNEKTNVGKVHFWPYFAFFIVEIMIFYCAFRDYKRRNEMSVSDDCGNKEIAEPLKINDSETTTIGRDFVETTDE